MKKYISVGLVALIVMCIVVNCKKSDTLKDYGTSIKDKTWWGAFTRIDEKTEYYSVHFNADSSLLWSDLRGNYDGKWSINGNRITMTFTLNKVQIKAEISDEDKLMNITDNASFYDVNSGELIASPNISLDNTVWNGSANITTSKALQLSFKPGSLIYINIENTRVSSYSYTRSTSGSVIRAIQNDGAIFFGVITSGSEMKGSVGSSDSPWQTVKN